MKTMSKNKIRMKRLFFVLLGVALYVQAEAQPARRRVKPNDADKAEKTVDRASLHALPQFRRGDPAARCEPCGAGV